MVGVSLGLRWQVISCLEPRGVLPGPTMHSTKRCLSSNECLSCHVAPPVSLHEVVSPHGSFLWRTTDGAFDVAGGGGSWDYPES